jgi:hypothetical protein
MYEDRCTMYVSQWLDYQYIAKNYSSVYLGFTKCVVIIIRYFKFN